MKNTTQDTAKQPYQAPKITEVGTVIERTLGQSTGTSLDADFPTGTEFGDLTFS